jgi:transmembrane sensor
VVDLNTNTEVRVAYTAAKRRIELVHGEAHFNVARNAVRPFVVSAGEVSVRAVGTAFNVRRFDSAIEVLVTEGKVGVQKSSDDATPAASRSTAPADIIAAGQKVVVSAADVRAPQPVRLVASPVSSAEISQMLSWQEKRLDFAPVALKEIVAEFNRYSRHRLVIADDDLAALNVGGSFRAGDVEALVRLLQSNFEVEADVRRDETILRRKR